MGLLLILTLSYLAGSFPTSIIVARLVKNIDIRKHGSGNAGMSNVVRVVGWKAGLVVGTVDIFKGWLAAGVVAAWPLGNLLISDLGVVQIMAGLAAVLGHTFTIFGGFRGGKGVATLAGVLLTLYPVAIPLCAFVFSLVLMRWGYVSASSMSAAITLPIAVALLPLLGLEKAEPSLIIFSLFVPLFIIATHRSNIQRLKSGTEKKFEEVMILKSRKPR